MRGTAGISLTLKQNSVQTSNHIQGILIYARIVVTTTGFETTSPSLVTWRVPYSILSCVPYRSYVELNATPTSCQLLYSAVCRNSCSGILQELRRKGVCWTTFMNSYFMSKQERNCIISHKIM